MRRLRRRGPELETQLGTARTAYRAAREHELAQGDSLRVGVAGCNLSQNPAGRAVTLAEAHQTQTSTVEMLGWIHGARDLWAPLREYDLPIHTQRLERDTDFLHTALELTLAHPYDIVHLSKPRFPNIVLGRLQELIWGASLILDIDDEELSFAGGKRPLRLDQATSRSGRLKSPEDPKNSYFTRLGVGMSQTFETITVSNPALADVYGGSLVPHIRNEQEFMPSPERTRAARRKWGIDEQNTIVLFFGTPRRHKGLVETAHALNELNRSDVTYVVVGDFPISARDVKTELEQMHGLRCQFLPGQPYSSIPDVVALGDVTVLPQNPTSRVARYQLPAKLMDALAMNVGAFVGVTPATQWLADAGAVIPIEEGRLAEQLAEYLDHPQQAADQRAAGRRIFEEQLSLGSVTSKFARLHAERSHFQRSWDGHLRPLLYHRLEKLLDIDASRAQPTPEREGT